jgi:tRNA-dihydrouridine synthase A
MGSDAGFCEINLNIGCPSERVQNGAFGACLMAEPELVAECVSAMRAAVDIPVTVKCRIGIDDQDSEEALHQFVKTVKAGGCELFIIHARKAILKGLSPKQNREIPPLDYPRVYRLKKEFPDLKIVINGGLTDLPSALQQLQHVDGVMMGREAYQNPYILSGVDSAFYGENLTPVSRQQALALYLPYVESELAKGTPLQHISRHLLGLFKGERGGKQFRRYLSENAYKASAGIEVLTQACALTDTAPYTEEA